MTIQTLTNEIAAIIANEAAIVRSLTTAHLADNVRLCDDSSHKTCRTAHDHEVRPLMQLICRLG